MNKATSPLRVGLIGAGHISADYLRATRFFEQQMKVVVCADLNAAAAEARAREFGIEFTSIEAFSQRTIGSGPRQGESFPVEVQTHFGALLDFQVVH